MAKMSCPPSLVEHDDCIDLNHGWQSSTTDLSYYSPALSVGTNLIHGKKMRDFMVEFLKCAKFHGKFTEGV